MSLGRVLKANILLFTAAPIDWKCGRIHAHKTFIQSTDVIGTHKIYTLKEVCDTD